MQDARTQNMPTLLIFVLVVLAFYFGGVHRRSRAPFLYTLTGLWAVTFFVHAAGLTWDGRPSVVDGIGVATVRVAIVGGLAYGIGRIVRPRRNDGFR